MRRSYIPDGSAVLNYTPSMLSTEQTLWFCARPEDAAFLAVNAVSRKPGQPLRDAANFLTAFPDILLIGGEAEEREAIGEELRADIPGLQLWNTPQSAYYESGGLEDLWMHHGREAVEALPRRKEALPPAGVLDLSRLERDTTEKKLLSTGLPSLDALLGGFAPGELTVWTGQRKEGKSTLLGLPVLAALRAGEKVCLYSGELSAQRFRRWLLSMAAGPKAMDCRVLPGGRRVCQPKAEAVERIDRWWRGRVFLLDGSAPGADRADNILRMFRDCQRLCGASVFVLDNLMTVELGGAEVYQAQSRFVGQLQDFARTAGVHVHLTAHCRKNSRGGGCDEVSGSSDITNRADNILRIFREKGADRDAVLRLLDNREYGARGDIPLRFDPVSRRFYEPRQGADWPCGWESLD